MTAKFLSPRTIPNHTVSIVLTLTAVLLEMQAIISGSVIGATMLNYAIFLIIYGELHSRHTAKQQSIEIDDIPVYELEQLHRYAELGRITGGFVHDLANPLTAVTLHLEDLHDQLPTHQVKRALAGTQTMGLYVKAVRNQLSGNRITEDFNVRQVIDTVEQMTAYKARQLNVSIQVDCQVDLLFSGSPVRFQQALSNLVSNAIDSYQNFETKDRTLSIKVKDRPTKIVIEVSDHGSGIADDNLTKIFEPFFTTKTLHQGTGIGLAITKDVIEKEFGGSITATSKLGRGTTFCLTLPKRREKITA